MQAFFTESVYFGVVLSLAAYGIGSLLKRKFKSGLCNPLLIAILLTIAVLVVSGISYDTFNVSGKYLSYLLTPATICLAVPLYEKFEVLKKNKTAVLIGILSGAVTSMAVITVCALILHFDHAELASFLPKSITTAIGMGVSEELGGYPAVTATIIVITGVSGNVLAETVLKVFRITDPIAKGIAVGSAAHAIGTAKAMEIGEVEGAMSSLSIVVAGLITVVLAPIFAAII